MKTISLLFGALLSASVWADSTPVQTLESFLTAINKEDRAAAMRTLSPQAQIYESGYVEQSRDEYLAHHFASDAKFAQGVRTKVLKRNESQSGEMAVIWSETQTEGSYKGKPVKLLGTETVVLKQQNGDWQIMHIHWSSRKPG